MPLDSATRSPAGSKTYRLKPSSIEELPLRIAARNGSFVDTFSDHSWQLTAQTVGSGSVAMGVGAGLCMVPSNVSTGCAADSAVPSATGVGDDVLTGGTANAGSAAAPTTTA